MLKTVGVVCILVVLSSSVVTLVLCTLVDSVIVDISVDGIIPGVLASLVVTTSSVRLFVDA